MKIFLSLLVLISTIIGCSRSTAPEVSFDFDYPKKIKLNTIRFDKIMAQNSHFKKESNPELSNIIGSWGKGIIGNRPGDVQVITFFNNGTYLLYQNGDPSAPDEYGVEFGTYTYNEKTGELKVMAIVDENGGVGLADPARGDGPHTFNWKIQGNTAKFQAHDQKATIYRIGG